MFLGVILGTSIMWPYFGDYTTKLKVMLVLLLCCSLGRYYIGKG